MLEGALRDSLRRVPVQEGLPPGVANTSSLAGQCASTRNLLMDLELLSHADYFVGTQKSALSPIIEVGTCPFSPATGVGKRGCPCCMPQQGRKTGCRMGHAVNGSCDL